MDINITDWGYINSNCGDSNKSDMYVGSPSHRLIGYVGFNKSINSILGISASLWQEIYYTSDIILNLQSDGSPAVLPDGYTLGLGVVRNPTQGSLKLTKAVVTKDNCSLGSGETFNLTELFKSLTDNSTFSPSSSNWYVYFQGKSGADRKFENGVGTLTINGIISSNLHYNNGTSWERCIPYYYNGTNWIQCQANYHDGNNWIKT